MKTLIFAIRKITVILILLTLGVTGSCKEESKKKESTTKTSTSATPKLSKDNSSDSKGDIALNPAHGQPGHRCDIAVGAPLNSGDIKLNPAHGQPGHRCDIAVGAPLNSAPATSSDNTQSGSPVINSGDVKLNPAHGQPGHRCDIKVGDPL